MKLIVARHGETLWNVQNKVLGRNGMHAETLDELSVWKVVQNRANNREKQ